MKRITLFIIILALLMCGCAPEGSAAPAEVAESPAPSESPAPTLPPEIEALLDKNAQVWLEKHERQWMIGRLIVPDSGIDVAVFIHGWGEDAADIRQNVCDAEDSAILYSDGVGNIIADHNNQGFINLPNVKKGDVAYILAGDCIVTLECDLVTDGINTGEGITDLENRWVSAEEDYTLYTCGEDWVNIKIAGFKEVDEDHFEMETPSWLIEQQENLNEPDEYLE